MDRRTLPQYIDSRQDTVSIFSKLRWSNRWEAGLIRESYDIPGIAHIRVLGHQQQPDTTTPGSESLETSAGQMLIADYGKNAVCLNEEVIL